MMKIFSFLVSCTFLFNVAHARIVTSNSLSLIPEQIEACCEKPQDILVVFDVDDVILMPKDEILQSKNRPIAEQVLRELLGYPGFSQFKQTEKELVAKILAQREEKLVDDSLLDILSLLRSKGVKYLALTHCDTGEIGCIESLEKWRIDGLTKLGVEFTFQPDTQFSLGPKPANRLGPPLFTNGIIFTAGQDKGSMLKVCLEKCGKSPRLIIFADDKKKNVVSVQKYCHEKTIDYLGIHYTAANDKASPVQNMERVKHQVKHFLETGQWLSDEEAEAVLALP